MHSGSMDTMSSLPQPSRRLYVKLHVIHSFTVQWTLPVQLTSYMSNVFECICAQSAVTQSVANTAKRVIVIVGVAMVLGESLDPMKLIGCGIGIGGVLLYSIIDTLVKPKEAASA